MYRDSVISITPALLSQEKFMVDMITAPPIGPQELKADCRLPYVVDLISTPFYGGGVYENWFVVSSFSGTFPIGRKNILLFYMLNDGDYMVINRHPATDMESLLPLLSSFEYRGSDANIPRFTK